MNIASKESDAILAVLHRMPLKSTEAFLMSLKATGYKGRIVFFTSMISPDTRNGLQRLGVEVVPFIFLGRHVRQRLARPWPIWKGYFSLPQPRWLKDFVSHRVLHLFYLRHLLYLRYIERTPQIKRVLMCDCRDVYFQSDPFTNWPNKGLHAFEEDRNILIGQCEHHRRWLSQLAGPKMLENLALKPRVCAGTIMADNASAMAFLRDMLSMTYSARSLEPFDGDQGLFNILVHKVQPPYVIKHTNGSSNVFTVGSMPDENIKMDEQGFILGNDGTRSPILHQYDRKPEIAKALLDHLEL